MGQRRPGEIWKQTNENEITRLCWLQWGVLKEKDTYRWLF